MTSLALHPPLTFSLLPALFERQRTLTRFGLVLLALALPCLLLALADPARLPTGISPWVKPTKFFVSTGVFALTTAWFFGFVRDERRAAPLLRYGVVLPLVAAASFEMFWIVWQAAHGVDSHYNNARPIDGIMFGLMGLFAVVLTASLVPLAWEIARRPRPGLAAYFGTALVAALLLTFLLGTLTGAALGSNGGHAVGAYGSPLPLLGWNRIGGDLRVAHFLGLHAQQIVPVGALLIAGLAPALRRRLLAGGILLYPVLTVALLAQALAGLPVLPA
jgi:hypothetical protein